MARMHSRLALVLSCLLAGGYASCGDEEEPQSLDHDADHDHDHHGEHDAAAPDAALADAGLTDDVEVYEDVPCAADYPVYKDGMSAKAGELVVRLLSVSPAPPRQKTPNNWVFSVVDAEGTPVSGVSFGTPDSYMPVHRHHGRTPPIAAAGTQPGQVLLNAIDFKMRGPWQVNFDVVPAGGQPIATTFQICVE
jgi:hypothetical protein